MKHCIRHMALVALLLASTTLRAQTTPVAITNADMPYICTFENDADTTHWGIVNGTQANAWYIGQATALQGSHSLYISKDNGATNTYNISSTSRSYAYLPVTFGQEGEYRFKFDWRCVGEATSYLTYDYLQVFLAPASENPVAGSEPNDSWTELSPQLANAASLSHFSTVIDIESTSLGSYKLVFFWKNDYSSGDNPPAVVDNVELSLITCHIPDQIFITPSQTSAVIDWTTHGNESSWIISLNNAVVDTTSTKPFTLNGLTPNSPYEVSIQALCGPNESSEARRQTFRTACPPMEVPFYEGFATSTLGDAPDCWNIVVPTIVEDYDYLTGQWISTAYPIIASEGITGNNFSMAFVSEGDTGYVASSAIPLPGNAIHVSFLAMGDLVYDTMWMQAGVMTDLSDTTTFVPLVNVDVFDEEFHLYEFNTSGLPAANTYYLAFRFYSDFYMNNIQLDEIQIREDMGCFIPSELSIVSVEPDAVTLSWEDSSTIVTSYSLHYSTENDFSTAQSVTVTSSPYRLTGLTPNTTYYCWVATVCDTLSSYSRTFPVFTTHPACAPLMNTRVDTAYYTAVTVSWEYDTTIGYTPMGAELMLVHPSENDDTITVTMGSEETSYTFTGLVPNSKYRIYFRSICSAGTEIDTSETVYRPFMTATCADISTNDTNASIHAPFDCYYGFSYAQMLYTQAQMPLIDTIRGIAFKVNNVLPATYYIDIYMGHTSLDHLSNNNYVPLSDLHLVASDYAVIGDDDPGWHVFYLDSAFVYDGTSNLVIAVDNNTNQWYENIEWNYHPTDSIQTVFWYQDYYDILPSNPQAQQYGTLQGALDIRFNATCNEPECFAPILTLESVTENTATVEWQISGTEHIFIPAYRPAASTAWTLLDSVSGTSYTFTGLTPGSRYDLSVGSLCNNDTLWNMVTANTDCANIPVPYTNDFAYLADNETIPCWSYNSSLVSIHNHTLHLAPAATPTAVVLPPTQAEVNTLELRVDALTAQNDSLLIGVTDSEGDNIEWLDTLHLTGQTMAAATPFFYRFTDYTGNGTRLAFSHTASTTDTLVVNTVSIVLAPTCLPPYDLDVQHLDNPDSVTVSWNTRGSANTWQVVCDTLGANLTSIASNAITTHNPFCLLPPLEYGRNYKVWVKAVCEDTEEQWVALIFATEPFVCQPVTGLSAQATTPRTAQVSWNATVAESYLVYLQADNDTRWTILPTESNTLTITILNPNTHYDLYVRTLCGEGDTSVASDTISFSTPQLPCTTPTNLSVSDITDEEATIAWTAVGTETQWVLSLNDILINASSNPITITDLTPSTNYSVRVRAVCGEGDSSAWSPAVNFSTLTPTPCYTPLSFYSHDLTAHSVTLEWTSTNGEENWEIALGDSIIPVQSNPYTLLGLTPATPYSARVRALCSPQHVSEWSSPIAFTTLEEQGIEAIETDNITLYPNPASSSVTLTGLGMDDIITVVDLNGRLCGTWHSNSDVLTIDISSLATGTYFVHIIGPQFSTVKKLIVQ